MLRTALAGGGEDEAAEGGDGKVRLQSSYSACTRDDDGRVGTPHAIGLGAGASYHPARLALRCIRRSGGAAAASPALAGRRRFGGGWFRPSGETITIFF